MHASVNKIHKWGSSGMSPLMHKVCSSRQDRKNVCS